MVVYLVFKTGLSIYQDSAYFLAATAPPVGQGVAAGGKPQRGRSDSGM